MRQPHEGLPTAAGHSAGTQHRAASVAEPGDGAPCNADAAAAFNWKKSIKTQLRAATGQQLSLKRLRKGTIAACQAPGGRAGAAEDRTQLRATFAKKLAKMTAVEQVGDTVRLKQ